MPKFPKPTYVKEFRPIACCTTLYKLIPKVINVRHKLVVDKPVGPSQSAFIVGRNILDNVILPYKLAKGYNRKGMSPICLVKIDIRKAYDTIKWGFLRMVLLEFGMPLQFVILIIECVSAISYSIIFNGGFTPKFQAKKGFYGRILCPQIFLY